jgi:ABC-type Na+ efflux pump permease subunit
LQPADYVLFTVDDEGRPESSGSFQGEVARVAPAFLSQCFSEEKENRMVEMLITSTSPISIMLGKITGLGASGLLLIALSGLFLMWLSAQVFRAGLLLYGQRMGIGNVLRALRQADY